MMPVPHSMLATSADAMIFDYWLLVTSAFSALTLLVGWQEGHPAYKN